MSAMDLPTLRCCERMVGSPLLLQACLGSEACVSVDVDRLPVTERARMMRELTRATMLDKGYRRYPIGREVARFLRHLRWGDCAEGTLDAYETVLDKFARDHADFQGLDRFNGQLGGEYVAEFLERRWGDASVATKRQRQAILSSFFEWAVRENKIDANPVRRIRKPKGRGTVRLAYDQATLHRLVTAQPSMRDQCALQLLCRMGFRKNELRLVRIRDIDLTRGLIVVHGKGEDALAELGLASLREDLYLHIQAESREPDEYLLYPRGDRFRPMAYASSIHRWFKRCLDVAGLPDSIKMHEMRHSAADDLWRRTGNLMLAKQFLRHKSVKTTEDYLHPNREDLASALAKLDDGWNT